MIRLYCYKAVIASIYDGDTVRVDIDLGLQVWVRNHSVRLTGLDAPEVRGPERPEGLKAKEYLMSLIPPGTEVHLHLEKSKDKYGRFIATIYYPHDHSKSINDMLKEAGFDTTA